jgi:hypothetical protein
MDQPEVLVTEDVARDECGGFPEVFPQEQFFYKIVRTFSGSRASGTGAIIYEEWEM